MSTRPPASPLLLLAFVAGLAGGCSSTTPRIAFAVKESTVARITAPDAARSMEAPAAEPEAKSPSRNADEILASCVADGKKKCVLAQADASELCRSMTPSAALHVFASNKKMRVGYLTRDMEAWSTDHARQTKSRARFDEEVMVLATRSSKSSVVVQGAAVTYEVLRWDGSCASLMGDELTFRRAPRPIRPIRVDRLYLPAQTKLLDDPRIRAAADRADTTCGADDKAIACDIARRAFGDVVVARAGRLGL
jgi:hypothetical protein